MNSIHKYVKVKKDVAGGASVFRGTRIAVKTLFDYLEEEIFRRISERISSIAREQAEG